MNTIYIIGTEHTVCGGHGEYWPEYSPSFEHGYFTSMVDAEDYCKKLGGTYIIRAVQPAKSYTEIKSVKTFHKVYK